MISAIKGKVFSIKPGIVDIKCDNGLYYQVNCPISVYNEYEVNKEIFLYTQLRIKDDIATLYGFVSTMQKELFIKLSSVNGIGYKTALSILSSLDVNDLISAVENGEVEKINAIPGIGKKTAQRLILELSGKLNFALLEPIKEENSKIREDLISALCNLGYSAKKGSSIVTAIFKKEDIKDKSFEKLFKIALKKINK